MAKVEVMTIPDMPKIDLSETMTQLLDHLRDLERYVDSANDAKKRIKEIERTLVFLNSVTSIPVNIGANGKGTTTGMKLIRRKGILYDEYEDGTGTWFCMVEGCDAEYQHAGSWTHHFKKNHPTAWEANDPTK